MRFVNQNVQQSHDWPLGIATGKNSNLLFLLAAGRVRMTAGDYHTWSVICCLLIPNPLLGGISFLISFFPQK